eukprot:6396555-Prymnesium_polylepis.2
MDRTSNELDQEWSRATGDRTGAVSRPSVYVVHATTDRLCSGRKRKAPMHRDRLCSGRKRKAPMHREAR